MKMSRKDPDFYSIMGPVFGSREIQRKTGDRFFDDDNKEWHVFTDLQGNVHSNIRKQEFDKKRIFQRYGLPAPSAQRYIS